MSKNVVTPKSVSFEDALRNLASRLTGRSATELPRTQEGIVQFMAENVPAPDEMMEAITQEVMVRLAAAAEAEQPDSGQQEGHNSPEASGGTPTPGEGEKPDRSAPVADDKPKRGSKTANKKG